ncbi:glycosyltransferase [Candidatus Bathyarchaeota archaeon]|nr:glycosyltransferase [Candidatus Bathyarchaeota archaeon]
MRFSITDNVFDVVIPTKNSAKTFSLSFKGLLKSDVSVNEIIVVDNSEDNTPKIAQKLGCQVIRSKAKYSQALRIGANRAKTDYILILDSDIIINKNFYSKLMNFLGTFFIVKGVQRHQINWKELGDWILYSQLKKIKALEAAFVHRRTFLRLTKSWEEGLIDAGGDVWLYEHCKRLNIPVFFSPQVVSIHLTGDFRRLLSQARWYGKSARKSKIHSNKTIFSKLLKSPFSGFLMVLRFKSLQLLPFFVNYQINQVWGYIFN